MKQRLIDANDAIDWLEERKRWQPINGVCYKNQNGQICAPVDSLEEFIRNRPTVDAVEVVRCRDCRFYDWQEGTCKYWKDATFTEPDGFCPYGERKENNDG